MGDDAHALRQILEVSFKADQPTGGDRRNEGGVLAVGFHVLNLGLTAGEIAHDIAEGEGRDFGVQGLNGLDDGTVLRFLEDDFRAGD